MPKREPSVRVAFGTEHGSSPSDEARDDALISHAIAYFESFSSAASVINACTDRAQRGSHVLHGWKFPICIVIEALNSILENCPSLKLKCLKDDLRMHLRRSVASSRFRYFEEPPFPEDLDTAASVMRLLGEDDRHLRVDYARLLERNRLQNGMFPTWLDVANHAEWRSGDEAHHLDVMLNYWLTQVYLGDKVDLNLILQFVKSKHLENYWYVQSMYTPLLYFKLLLSVGIKHEKQFYLPLDDVIEQYASKRDGFVNSAVNISSVATLVQSQQDRGFNDYICASIQRLPECSKPPIGLSRLWSPLITQSTVLYWSLGFKSYSCLPTTYALLVNVATLSLGLCKMKHSGAMK